MLSHSVTEALLRQLEHLAQDAAGLDDERMRVGLIAAHDLAAQVAAAQPDAAQYLSQLPVPLLIVDARGQAEAGNEALCALLALKPDELRNVNWVDLMVNAVRLPSLVEWPHLTRPLEAQLRRSDGAEVWVEVRATELAGRRLLLAALDISGRKRIEENLRGNELRLQALVSSVDEIVFELDADATVINVWAKDRALLPRPAGELLGRRLADVLPPAPGMQLTALVRRVLRSGVPESAEVPLEVMHDPAGVVREPAGAAPERWFQVRGAPVLSANSLVKTACLVARDVTDRYQAEQTLAQSAAEISVLYRASANLLAAATDSQRLVGYIAGALAVELAPAACTLLLPDPTGRSLEAVAQAGDYPARVAAVPIDQPGPIAESYRRGEVVYMEDLQAEVEQGPAGRPPRSQLSAPLKAGAGVFGVLDLQSPEPNAFTDRAIRMTRVFAEQAGLALANARLLVNLDRARQAAEEASRLKSEFLANTSHELRTPLSTIMGVLDILIEDLAMDAGEQKRLLRTAHGSSQRLLYLISDLLDFAKIEAGRMDVDLQQVDLVPILADVYLVMRGDADARGLELSVLTPNEADLLSMPLVVRADAYKVRQILIGLVANALKFTTAGQITVSVERLPASVVVRVTDSGIGIAPDKQDTIFDAFVQGDGSATRRYAGTGLGLAIAQRLARLMRGDLRLARSALGQGSTFELELQNDL
jgi:PAS domain S-box-containing protein